MAKVISITRRIHTIKESVEGVENAFEVLFEPCEYRAIHVKISEDGRRAVVGYLSRDESPSDSRKEFDQIDHMICWHNRYTLGDEHSFKDSDELFKELCREAIGDDNRWERMLEKLDTKVDKIYRASDTSTDRGRVAFWKDQDAVTADFYHKIFNKHYVMLPLFLYDHSGITMSTGPFSCRWDSGMVGIIYMSKKDALDNWGGKIMSRKVREKCIASLKASIEEYDMFLTGEVYGVCSQCFVNVAAEGDDPKWEAFEDRGLIGYNSNRTPIYGDVGRDECWGFYGDKYAEEELESRVEQYDAWLASPLYEPEEEAS